MISHANEIETLDAFDGRSVSKLRLTSFVRSMDVTPSGAFVYVVEQATQVPSASRSNNRAPIVHRLDLASGKWEIASVEPAATAITPVADDLLVYTTGETVRHMTLARWSPPNGVSVLSSAQHRGRSVGAYDALRHRLLLHHNPYNVISVCEIDRNELRITGPHDTETGSSAAKVSRFTSDFQFLVSCGRLLDARTFKPVDQGIQTDEYALAASADMLFTSNAAYDLKTGERIQSWPVQFTMMALTRAGDRVVGYSSGNSLLMIYEIEP